MKQAISINPATNEQFAAYEQISVSEIQSKIQTAHQAYEGWKKLPYSERSKYFHKLAEVFEKNKEAYARLATKEMGKTIVQARKEIEKCALVCRYYADNTSHLLKDEPVVTEASKSYVTFSPMGVVLAVMPWNFPFYQVVRFAAPALMAGNTGVLKHASNVQGTAFALEQAFAEAGFPKGIFTNLNISASLVKSIIEDKHIVAVTLTGSDAAGRSVASIAGANLKKTVLELGGSDPYIVLEDADIEFATDLLLLGRLQNNGQTCISSKRLIIVKSIYEVFLKSYKTKMESAKMGDPMDEKNYYGPMARVDLRDEIHHQVELSISQGARLVTGGKIPDLLGAYYPATILADVKPGMEAFDNELFGPVASVICAKDEKEAIALANHSQFGLGSGVITSDKARGERIALQIEAGSCFINKLTISDPRLPFGGVKNSGYGRELAGYGIREFVSVKSVWVD